MENESQQNPAMSERELLAKGYQFCDGYSDKKIFEQAMEALKNEGKWDAQVTEEQGLWGIWIREK